nr:rrna methyltransferase 1, mitochondrial [Quercus suber]
MSIALRPVCSKLHWTFLELTSLPRFRAQRQTRSKSISSAIKGGLVREGRNRDRRQGDEAREVQPFKRGSTSYGSEDRRFRTRETPSYGRDDTFAPRSKSLQSREYEQTYRGRKDAVNGLGGRNVSSFGRRDRPYQGRDKSERSIDSKDTGRPSRHDVEPFRGNRTRLNHTTRDSTSFKRHQSSGERQSQFLGSARGQSHDSRRGSYKNDLGFPSRSGQDVEQSKKQTIPADLAMSKGHAGESDQLEFSGKAWEVPANVGHIRTLLNSSGPMTAAQYRVGAEVLEGVIRKRLQNGQKQGSVQDVEAMLSDFDRKWAHTKPEASEIMDEPLAKRKLELEHDMQRLLAQLPDDDRDRERWSRWILTAQLKRHDVPLRVLGHTIKSNASVEPAHTKNKLVAAMQQLLDELPETDKDQRNYASHLKHHNRLQKLTERSDKAATMHVGGKEKGTTPGSKDEFAGRRGLKVHGTASQQDTETQAVLSKSEIGTAAIEDAATQKQERTRDKQTEILQHQHPTPESLTSRQNTIVKSSIDRDTYSSDDTLLTVPYSAAASTFLYGNNVVLAALRAKRRRLYRLYTAERDNRGLRRAVDRSGANTASINNIISLANQAGLAIEFDTPVRVLDKMSESRPHNGVVLEASYIPSPPVLSIGSPDAASSNIPVVLSHQSAEEADVNGTPSTIPCVTPKKNGRQPIVVLLDGITDPGNLGNILRSAHFYGVDAVAIATNTCASLNLATLAKASSGACEAVSILSLPKPANFVAEAGKAGWKIYAAVAPSSGLIGDRAPPTIRRVTTSTLGNPLERKPVLLMLGAEGEGLRANLTNKAGYWLSIEQSKSQQSGPKEAVDVGVESLNVGVAAGVLMERFLKPAAAATKETFIPVNPSPSTIAKKDEKNEDAAANEFGIVGGLGF